MPFEGSVPDAGTPHPRPGPLAFAASIVPTLSFWAMKELAARTGRQGVAPLLARLQAAVDPPPRFHLMGHSFGAKLVAETLADRDGRGVGPVDTMFLVEGALSTWAFASTNPYRDPVGAAAPVFTRHEVRGVSVASTSRWDWALGRMFPAAQVLDTVVKRIRHAQLPFARLHRAGVAPRLAALGTDGFEGTGQQELVPPGRRRRSVSARVTTTAWSPTTS
jgi:pimeloyl-ACP methyl ester carboxylesterase